MNNILSKAFIDSTNGVIKKSDFLDEDKSDKNSILNLNSNDLEFNFPIVKGHGKVFDEAHYHEDFETPNSPLKNPAFSPPHQHIR